MSTLDESQVVLDKNIINSCMLEYEAALRFLETVITILRSEFKLMNNYDPVDHVVTRIKSTDSILNKMHNKKLEMSINSMQDNLYDIVGLRLVCSFKNDVYDLVNIIRKCKSIKVIEEKDYIENPKDTGYSSYHLKVLVLVPFANDIKAIKAEIQIRTMAMDFWASIDHKLNYKVDFNDEYMNQEFKEIAEEVKELDNRMAKLVKRLKK